MTPKHEGRFSAGEEEENWPNGQYNIRVSTPARSCACCQIRLGVSFGGGAQCFRFKNAKNKTHAKNKLTHG